jgi:hypothetical protein
MELPPASVDDLGGVALGDHGALVADWSRSGRRGDQLVVARQSRFGSPIRLRTFFSDPEHLPIAPLEPAFDGAGGVIVPFVGASLGCGVFSSESRGGSKCVPVPQRSMVLTVSSSGRSHVQLLGSGCAEGPFVRGPRGTAAILLMCDRPGGGTRMLVSERLPDGTFGKPIPVFASGKTANTISPTMTIGADGRVWVAFDYQKPRKNIARFFEIRTDIVSAVYGAKFRAPQWTTAYVKDFVDQTSVPILLRGTSGGMYLMSQNQKFALVAQRVQPGGLGTPKQISPDDVNNVSAQADSRGLAIVIWARTASQGNSHIINRIETTELKLP